MVEPSGPSRSRDWRKLGRLVAIHHETETGEGKIATLECVAHQALAKTPISCDSMCTTRRYNGDVHVHFMSSEAPLLVCLRQSLFRIVYLDERVLRSVM